MISCLIHKSVSPDIPSDFTVLAKSRIVVKVNKNGQKIYKKKDC